MDKKKKQKWPNGPAAVIRLFRKQPQHPPSSAISEGLAEARTAQPDEAFSSPEVATSSRLKQAVSSEPDQVAPASTSSKPVERLDKTFRVQGIPLDTSVEQTKQLIQRSLGCSGDDTGLQCRSLAIHHSGTSQDATILFSKGCPPCLQMKLPYSNETGGNDNIPKLTFDESFLGLTTINSCPANIHQVNVVALSGIGGHAFGSFKSRGKPHMWLRDDLPKDLPGSCVMLWGYESTIAKSKDTKSIQDISRQLRHDLSQISETVRSQPFIFLAHSLGGLVLKKLLIDLCNSNRGPNNDSAASDLTNLIRGVIFCGVPHFGLETQVINTLVQMADNQPNEPLLHSIRQDSELLEQMHNLYAALFSQDNFPNSTTCCVYETKLSPTAVQTAGKWSMTGSPALFVSKQSATAPRHGEGNTELSLPVDETHSDLVKFAHGSPHYRRIVQIMKDSLGKRVRPIYKFNDEELECLQTLYPGDYKRYKDRNPERVDGTCRWVLDHPLYGDWLQISQSSLLWVSADPGCGKSVLAKALIDRDLAISDDAPLLYFFFKDDDAVQRSPAKAMAALLHQLFSIPQWRFLIRHAMPDYRSIGQDFVASFSLLWDIFVLAVSDPRTGPIYCVIDALDECAKEDRSELLHTLEDAFTEPENAGLRGNVKFLVTSRPYQDIERRFFFLIRLEGEKETKIIKQEIDRVIKHKVPELSKRLRLDQSQQALLQTKLLSVEHRTYLWLHLVLENLMQSNNFNRKKFDQIIEDLPRSVEAAYEKILSKGEKSEQEKLLELLQLVIAATRPLSIRELNLVHPLRLNDPRSHKKFVDEELEPDDQFKTTMRSWCGLFLTVVDDLVYLLHQTAREFLVTKQFDQVIVSTGWKHSIDLQRAEILITQKCVAYLLFPEFNEEFISGKLEEDFGFFEYAACTWYHHFREIQTVLAREGLFDLFPAIYELYNVHSHRFGNWARTGKGRAEFSMSKPLMVATDLSHHLALVGFSRAGLDLEITDGDQDHTPFLRAVSRRDLITSKALFELGANIEAHDARGQTALTISSRDKNGGDLLQFLIDIGANLEAKDSSGKTALQHALIANFEDAIKKLLEAGADKESKDVESRSILSYLAESNSSQAVRVLLSCGVECDSVDRSGRSPLMWAASCGSDATDVMELLISYGSDVNKRDKYGCTALHLAASVCSLSSVKLLLRHNAAVNTRSSAGQTPLGTLLHPPTMMFRKNSLEVMRLFIAWKADINAKEVHDCTALCSVLKGHSLYDLSSYKSSDHVDIVITEQFIQELLDLGAEIDTTDDTERTPLFWALEGGPTCLRLAEMLVNAGANEGSRILQGHSIEYWAEIQSSPAAEVDGVESAAECIARQRAAAEAMAAPRMINSESNPFGATTQFFMA